MTSEGTSFPLPLTGITQISTATLNTALTSANVDLQANKWIDFKTAFAYSGSPDTTLGLYAPTIKLGGDISSSNGQLGLNFGGTPRGTSTVYTGNLFLDVAACSITTRGGAITFNGNIGGAQNLSINTGAGAVNFKAAVNGTLMSRP